MSTGSAVHGITGFLDLTQLEFEAKYLTADVSQKSSDAKVAEMAGEPNASSGLVDWTGKYTTPVKNQGPKSSFNFTTSTSTY